MKNKLNAKILFVINPVSGNNNKSGIKQLMEQEAEKRNFAWDIYETTGENDKKEIEKQIDNFNPEMIIAAGGDGTVNMIASLLIGSDIVLGIIPAGSANGLAFNLGIPVFFKRALQFNLDTEPKSIDVIRINGQYNCLHLSDVGINARIVKRFEKEGSKGLFGYGKQLFKELWEGKTWFPCYIEVPGKRRKKMHAEMIVIANAQRFGTGASINPTGKMNDGKFEIVVIRPYPWWFVFTFVFAVFTGQLHKMKYVRIYSATEAKIFLPEKQELQVDGEIIPETGSLKVEIVPGALKVIRK